MKILKYLMLAAGLIVLLALITIGIFLATFDANQYKQELADLVQQQTGRELRFEGDIGLSLYPSLGMNLGAMKLSNAAGFGAQPMLAVERVNASVDLLSILSLQPQIAELLLDGLELDLQKNAKGVANWDDLLPKEDAESDQADAKTEAEQAEPSQPLEIAGSFGGLNINNARIRWRDAQAGADYSVTDLDLKTGRIEPEKPFDLVLQVAVESGQQLNSRLKLEGQALFQQPRLTLSGLKLAASASGSLLPADKVELKLTSDVDFSLQSNQLALKGLSSQVRTEGGTTPTTNLEFASEVGFDLNTQQLTLAVVDINADLAGEAIPNGKMSVKLSTPQLDLRLAERRISLPDLVLMLNDNRFNGEIEVADYAQPAAAFKLSSKHVDVDKLTGWQPPPPSETEAAQPTADSPAEDIEIALPLELLRTLKLDGELSIDRLIAHGLTLDNSRIKISAANGLIDLNPIHIDLYQGSLDGSLGLDARAEKPVYKVSQKLAGFQFGDFLLDFMQKDPVSGAADLDLDLSTRGDWLSQLKQNLDGTVAVAIQDGALKGFNLRYEIDKAKASFKGEELGDRKVQQTDFSALSLSGVINDGIFSSDQLDLQAPLLRVGGSGKVDLPQESLDYLVRAKVVGTTKGQGAGSVDDLSGLLIPVRIKGAWTDPSIDVQYDEMMKAKFEAEKARIREEVAQEKAKLQQKLAQEKARLKAAQEKKLAAEKAALDKKKALAEAEQKAKIEAKKQKLKAEQEAKKKAAEDAAKKKLEDKLKKLF